jgi:hypothetical protein
MDSEYTDSGSECNSSRDKMNGIIPLEERDIQNLIDLANKAKQHSYSPVCSFLALSHAFILFISLSIVIYTCSVPFRSY